MCPLIEGMAMTPNLPQTYIDHRYRIEHELGQVGMGIV
jgi:hypothetical protein